jgi:hypothetical protein
MLPIVEERAEPAQMGNMGEPAGTVVLCIQKSGMSTGGSTRSMYPVEREVPEAPAAAEEAVGGAETGEAATNAVSQRTETTGELAVTAGLAETAEMVGAVGTAAAVASHRLPFGPLTPILMLVLAIRERLAHGWGRCPRRC